MAVAACLWRDLCVPWALVVLNERRREDGRLRQLLPPARSTPATSGCCLQKILAADWLCTLMGYILGFCARRASFRPCFVAGHYIPRFADISLPAGAG